MRTCFNATFLLDGNLDISHVTVALEKIVTWINANIGTNITNDLVTDQLKHLKEKLNQHFVKHTHGKECETQSF